MVSKAKSDGKGSEAKAASAADSQTIDLTALLSVIWRRRWLIAAITAIGTLAAAAVGSRITTAYTAKATIMVDPRTTNVINTQAVLSGLPADSQTMATTIALMQSRGFVEKVMTDLKLFDDPEFNLALLPPDQQSPLDLSKITDSVLALLPNEWLIATGLAKETEPVLESDAPRLARERAISRFSSSATYGVAGTSYLIDINFTSQDRDKAAVIATRIADLFVDDQRKQMSGATTKASTWLDQRVAEMKQEVAKSEADVERYRAEHNLISSAGDGPTLNDQQLGDMNGSLIQAKGDLSAAQAKLRLVRDLRSQGKAVDSIAEVVSSPVIVNLRSQETELLRQEAELRTLYGEKHPRMVWLQNEKDQLQGKIRAEIDRITQVLDNDVRVASARVATIQGQLDGLSTRNSKDKEAAIHLHELERVAQSNQELYAQLLQRLQETKQQEGLIDPDVRVVNVAAPPTSPSTPGTKLIAAAGFTISAMLASLLALLLEGLDRGLRSAREVEHTLGLPTIGLVPHLDRLKRNQKPHQYLLEKPLSAYAEAIRSILTALKLSSPTDPPKVVLFTSSLPEEGKTTMAVSLAALVARSQKRVLLIDLDLRHPSVHRALGWQVSSGIVEYVSGERSLEEVIHNDLESGIHFLPVKMQTTTPTELIESDRMKDLLKRCREMYDLIILDTPPVASVTDSKVAATLADRVVFVVQWGKTIESAAKDSVQALRDAGVDPAGAVLSQIDLRKHAQYGYGDIGQYYTRSSRYYVN
ncbi:MAG: polysaccharide biosynthesis tyrosine autokinase [Geminicoccaceae bacterium]